LKEVGEQAVIQVWSSLSRRWNCLFGLT
jgi:hypothetical protein